MSIQQMFFLLLLLTVGYFAIRLYGGVWRNIGLGKSYVPDGNPLRRWTNAGLIAFGQKKMFKRPLPAVFHLFIYLAFLITQIELVEIILDGLSGRHRLFALSLGGFYTFMISMIEILSILAFVATVIFLWRRNILRLSRFEMPEMAGWPKKDANLILIGELLLLIGIFTMNGSDTVLQSREPLSYPDTGFLAVSGMLGPVMFEGFSIELLIFLERAGWWLHILVVFGFVLYLPVSKHLHILLAFPNTYYASQRPPGTMNNMPEVMNEVKSMLGLEVTNQVADAVSEIPEFGANDVFNLTWKNLLDAYTCTECGRCTAVCPANITGKKLSPRKIMMDVRDRAEEIGKKLRSGDSLYIKKTQPAGPEILSKENFEDGRSLFDYISKEELHACTACNACVEACPVLINPLEIILEMRRYEILTMGSGAPDWVPMFNSLENNGAVWQVTADRDSWIKS